MTLLDTIQTLSGGPVGYGIGGGTLVASLIGLLKVAPGAIDRISRALATAWKRRAEAAKESAAAEHERARANRVEAEHDVQVTTITAEMLARYEARLTQAEKDAREARAAVDECERQHREAQEKHAEALALRDRRLDAQARAIAQLTEKVRALGGTPPDMQAVTGGRENT